MEPMEYVTVGEHQYKVIKTGRAQARQVLGVTRWLTEHGVPAFQDMQRSGVSMDNISGIEFVSHFVESMNDDALVDLFTILIGCEPEESEVHFDIAILIDVLVEVYERQPAVKRLVTRFFSPSNSTADTPERSMTSEPPMDGQTTE